MLEDDVGVIINQMEKMGHQQERPYHQELEMEEKILEQQPLEIVQQKDQENLQPLEEKKLYHKVNKGFYHNKKKKTNSIMNQEEMVLP
jgi:hypothetical protein